MKLINQLVVVASILMSQPIYSLNLQCEAPDPKNELISAPKARIINTDEYYNLENYTFRPRDEKKYSESEAVTKNLKFCRKPKSKFFIKESSNNFFVESRCSGGITKFTPIVFEDDLIFERFEWYYEKSDLRDLDWSKDYIYLMEDKSFYQIKFQQISGVRVVSHPLIIVKPDSFEIEIRDLPEKEESLRYTTSCKLAS
jgi:hypothetical protein